MKNKLILLGGRKWWMSPRSLTLCRTNLIQRRATGGQKEVEKDLSCNFLRAEGSFFQLRAIYSENINQKVFSNRKVQY
jgi:hypothetical protein